MYLAYTLKGAAAARQSEAVCLQQPALRVLSAMPMLPHTVPPCRVNRTIQSYGCSSKLQCEDGGPAPAQLAQAALYDVRKNMDAASHEMQETQNGCLHIVVHKGSILATQPNVQAWNDHFHAHSRARSRILMILLSTRHDNHSHTYQSHRHLLPS